MINNISNSAEDKEDWQFFFFVTPVAMVKTQTWQLDFGKTNPGLVYQLIWAQV